MKRSHVKEQKSHRFLSKGKVDKDLDGFIVSDKKVVCFNQFKYGRRTYASPVLSMFMTIRKPLEP